MANLSGTPRFWLHVNGWLTVGWFLQFPIVLVIEPNLKKSITYLIIISIAAAGLGQLAAWQACRVETRMDDNDKGGKDGCK